MLFFIIIAVIFLLSLTGIILSGVNWYKFGSLEIPSWVFGVLSLLVLLISIAFIADEHVHAEKYLELKTIYAESLQYQIDESYYKTDFIDNRANLIQDATNWNIEVRNHQYMHENSIWFNWFHGDYWMKIPLITWE